MLCYPDMNKKVITVNGRYTPKEMGITDAHNHIWISSQDVPAPNPPVLDHEEGIIKELFAYRQAGGGAQIDCQPGEAGRDALKLYLISGKTDVKILACTGFHLEQYYPQNNKVWNMNSTQAADHFLNEIQNGIAETSGGEKIYPGFIKIAVGENLAESPKELLEAAVAVSLETEFLIEMHTEKGAGVEEFINYFDTLGLEPDRLVICHIDKRPDFELHKELATAGYLLEYDTFFRPKYSPEENLWPLILNMVQAGFSDAIALGTDQADPSLWQALGTGPGLPGFVGVIKKRLDSEIQSPDIVTKLMGRNITSRLAVI